MTTFYNFTPQIETNWAKNIVKFILETWNINDVIEYVSFIYVWNKKKIKNNAM